MLTKTFAYARPNDKNLLIECACGCGGIRHLFDKKRRIHPFINGHNPIGKPSGNWRGARYINKRGYAGVWDHKRYRFIPEHRKVFEDHYNCMLLPWIDIHHIDGNRLNNAISNLQPLIHGRHSALENKIGIKATIFCKGHIPWGKGKKLGPPWNKGKPWSEEMKRKIGQAISQSYQKKKN